LCSKKKNCNPNSSSPSISLQRGSGSKMSGEEEENAAELKIGEG
jgi:hypothetical protein